MFVFDFISIGSTELYRKGRNRQKQIEKYIYISPPGIEPATHHFQNWRFKVACTSGPIFKKIMKRYPIFSVQIIKYQIDQMHK